MSEINQYGRKQNNTKDDIVRNENIRTDKEIEKETETDIQRTRETGREDKDRKTFFCDRGCHYTSDES